MKTKFLYRIARDFTCRFLPQLLQAHLQGRRQAALVFREPENHLQNGIFEKKSVFFVFAFFILPLAASFSEECKSGREMFEMSRYRDAISHFKECIQKNIDKSGSLAYLGRIYMEGQEELAAYPLFLKSIQEDATNKETLKHFQKLHENLEKSKPDELNNLLDKAIENSILVPPALYRQVRKYQQAEDFKNLNELFDKAFKAPEFENLQRLFPRVSSLIFYYSAIAKIKVLQDENTALELLSRSVQLDSGLQIAQSLHQKILGQARKRLEILMDRARDSFAKQDYESALSIWEQAKKISLSSSEVEEGIRISRAAKYSMINLKKAEEFFSKKEYEKALSELNFAIKAWEDNLRAKNLKERCEAEILKKMNIEKISENTKKEKEVTLLQTLTEAQNYLDSWRGLEAKETFEKVLSIESHHEIAKKGLEKAKELIQLRDELALAEKNYKIGDFSKALPVFEKLLNLHSPWPGLFISKLTSLYQMKNYDQCIETAKNWLKLYPGEKETLYYLGRSYEAKIDSQSEYRNLAIDTYNHILELDSNYIDVQARRNKLLKHQYVPYLFTTAFFLIFAVGIFWLFKTLPLRKKIRYIEEIEAASKALDHKKMLLLYEDFYKIDLDINETIRILPHIMLSLSERGMHDQVLKFANQILSAKKNHQQSLILMGKAYFHQNTFNSSLIRFFKAFLDSDLATKEALEFTGKKIVDGNVVTKESLEILRKYLEIHPEHDEARQMLIKHLEGEKIITKQLVEILLLEVQYNPKDVKSRLKLAEYYLGKQQTEEAIALCEEVINLDLSNKALHQLLYQAYEMQKNLPALKPVYEALLQLQPNSIVLQETMNKILLATGDQVLSQTSLNKMNLNSSPSKKTCPTCSHQNPPSHFVCEKCQSLL